MHITNLYTYTNILTHICIHTFPYTHIYTHLCIYICNFTPKKTTIGHIKIINLFPSC